MPGIFGAVGYSPEVCEKLRQQFEEPWGSSESVTLAGGILGGHAFSPHTALHRLSKSLTFAVDGEISIYTTAESAPSQPGMLFRLSSDLLTLGPSCKGNLALVDPHSGFWFLAAEWSGTFPLYYLVTDQGLIFCSRQKPLAHLCGSRPDPLGVVESVCFNYTLAGRTFFQNLRRLRPGEVLSYDPASKTLTSRETSQAWCKKLAADLEPNDIADEGWQALMKAVKQALPASQRHAVLVSGGWDSRILLAAAVSQTPPLPLCGYTHGDITSREFRITQAMCRSLSIPLRAEPLDDRLFDLGRLAGYFARTENIVFSHWHRAGRVLSESGVNCVSAGVSGEVLGGRYGYTQRLQGWAKAVSVASVLLGLPTGHVQRKSSPRQVIDFFRVQQLSKPWFLSDDFWQSIENPTESVNADIEMDLRQLLQRGVADPDQLAEAFILEHWGVQYQSAQILSCRSSVDVAIPFVDRDLLMLASGAPARIKIHNSLNRAILGRHARPLLKFPSAATLVPASWPMLLQEMSRAVRRTCEDSMWKLHFLSRGRVSPPRFSWVNFEFLRSGKSLRAVLEDLCTPLFDRKALGRRIEDVVQGRYQAWLFPVAETMTRVYTLDLLLR